MNQPSFIWVTEWTDLFVQMQKEMGTFSSSTQLMLNEAGDCVSKPVISAYQTFFEEKEGVLIPCLTETARDLEAIETWIGEPFSYVISSNGAQIYRKGQLDQRWEQQMRKLITEEDLEQDRQMIESIGIPTEAIEIIEGFYLKIKVLPFMNQAEYVVKLKQLFRGKIRTITPHRQSILVTSQRIDKVHALDYLLQSEELENIPLYTTGTQGVDQWFVSRGKPILTSGTSFSTHFMTPKVAEESEKRPVKILELLMKEVASDR